ncbi:alpha/beta fold hydrolase [Nocardia sp. NPDC004568]|uniref:thioesterase II family protein n=1 Tax=Nocardia sp. NPDC004568 TaxID=3154551 RepID=UPI0033B7F5E5
MVAARTNSRFEFWFPGASLDRRGRPLLCLAGAGGGTGEFRLWHAALADSANVVPVLLPGRERRIRETTYTSVPALADDLVEAAGPILTRPFSLFGYSLGALIMYEFARRVPVRLQANLTQLFVGGQPAPSRPQTDSARSHHTDDQLVEYLDRLGGTPTELLRNRSFMRPYLSCLRADLKLAETYRYVGPAKLSCPLTAFAGSQDEYTDRRTLPAWKSETTGEFRIVELPGGHFTLRSDRNLLLTEIDNTLRRSGSS